ncbi:LysE family translocator [Sulfurospirillum halorespirans]|nr:LysE family translocator [Sulfurospirillum halorespirans]
MMALHTWLLYTMVAFIAIASPGPAVLLAINNSVSYDLKATFFSSLGNAIGLFVLSSAAMLGLGVVLKTSLVLFLAFKILGACYLIYIGIKQFRALGSIFKQVDLGRHKSVAHYAKIFQKGFLVCITNPKPIIFFTALFPPFLNPEAPLLEQFFILTLTFMLLSFGTLMCYAFFAKRFKSWFLTHQRALWFNRVSGAIFIALGFGLLGLERK